LFGTAGAQTAEGGNRAMKPTKQKSRLAVRLPDALRDVLEETAKRRFTSNSEIVRVAFLEKFERDGICLPPKTVAA
jgi:hypothetical protein